MSPRLPRALLLLACLTLLGSATAAANANEAAPLLGLTIDEVTEQLGEPRFTLSHEGLTLCRFGTRKIAFRDGVAVEVSAVDEDESENKQEMLERVAKEKAQVGHRLLARFEASGEIEALDPRDQLEFWLTFQIRHPETDVTDKIARARTATNALKLVEQQSRQEAQIARLQERIADLEAEQTSPIRSIYPRRSYYPRHGHSHHSRHDRHKHGHHKKESPQREPTVAEQLLAKPPAPRTPAGRIGDHEEIFRPPTGVSPLVPTR